MILLAAVLAVLGTVLVAVSGYPGAPEPLLKAGVLLIGLAVCLLALPGVGTR
jgi:uncharacterized membrane protein